MTWHFCLPNKVFARLLIFTLLFKCLLLLYTDNVEELSHNISSLSDNLKNYTQHELAWTVDVVEGILNTTANETFPGVITNSLTTVNNFLFSKETLLEVGERAYNTSSR